MTPERIIVFLRTGGVEHVAAGAEAGRRPPGTVFVRCTAETTFEDILGHLMRGFGLVDGRRAAAVTTTNAAAIIRELRLFLERFPEGDTRPVLVLDEAQHVPPALLERLRFLAPATIPSAPVVPAIPAPVPAIPAPVVARSASIVDAHPPIPAPPAAHRWPPFATTLILVGLMALAVAGYYHFRRASLPTESAGASVGTIATSGIATESVLAHAASFAVVVASRTNEDGAGRIASQLERRGLSAFVDADEASSRFRVLVGPYATQPEAEAVLRDVSRTYSAAVMARLP